MTQLTESDMAVYLLWVLHTLMLCTLGPINADVSKTESILMLHKIYVQ